MNKTETKMMEMVKETGKAVATGYLKVKGKALFLDGEQVGEILGHRAWVRDKVYCDLRVMVQGKEIARGFCYFADAVKWARWNVPDLVGKKVMS